MNEADTLMRAHNFVYAAYGISALVLLGLVAVILYDQFAQRRALAELENGGIRRRSDKSGS